MPPSFELAVAESKESNEAARPLAAEGSAALRPRKIRNPWRRAEVAIAPLDLVTAGSELGNSKSSDHTGERGGSQDEKHPHDKSKRRPLRRKHTTGAASVLAQASAIHRKDQGGNGANEQLDMYTLLELLIESVKRGNEAEVLSLLDKYEGNILKVRGSVGETLLHFCFILGTPIHKVLVTYLLRKFAYRHDGSNQLIDDPYEGMEYEGEVSLHIAVVNKDLEAVRLLVDAGADVCAPRAVGLFFQRMEVYFGEFVLSFAACLNQQQMVKLFVARGADVNAQDSNGNTALHMLMLDRKREQETSGVLEQLVQGMQPEDADKDVRPPSASHLPPYAEMYTLLCSLGADQTLKNKRRLTPLTLAVDQAQQRMFDYVLKCQRVVLWSYGPVTMAKYPLLELDSANGDTELWNRTHGKTARYLNSRFTRRSMPNALQLIVDNQHKELLDIPVIWKLLQDKWEGYVGKNFVTFLSIHSLTMLAIVIMQILNAYQPSAFRVCAETCYWAAVFGTTLTASVQIYQILGESIKEFLFGRLSMDNWLALFYIGSMLGSVPFYVTGAVTPSNFSNGSQAANELVGAAGLAGFLYMLHFSRAFQKSGPLFVMILQMLTGDVVNWLFVFSIVLMGFNCAFMSIFTDPIQSAFSSPHGILSTGNQSFQAEEEDEEDEEEQAMTGFDTFGSALKSLWNVVMGNVSYSQLDNANNFTLAVTYYIVFTIIVVILLLNLLIAMMGHTFDKNVESVFLEWKLQRAHIILELERTYSFFPRKRPQEHICDGDHWWLLMEDTTSTKFDYYVGSREPDAKKPAYFRLSDPGAPSLSEIAGRSSTNHVARGGGGGSSLGRSLWTGAQSRITLANVLQRRKDAMPGACIRTAAVAELTRVASTVSAVADSAVAVGSAAPAALPANPAPTNPAPANPANPFEGENQFLAMAAES